MKPLLLFMALALASYCHAQQTPTQFTTTCDCRFGQEYERIAPGGYLVRSYTCEANSMGEPVHYRVTLMELRKDVHKLSAAQQKQYAETYLNALQDQLQQAGISTKQIDYKGQKGMEYTQQVKMEGEKLEQKTLVYKAGNQSVTLQLTTSPALMSSLYADFKQGFTFLVK